MTFTVRTVTVNGNLVPDGDYTVYVEFTEAHVQGPLRGIAFTKGVELVSLTPVEDANFKDLALSFEPVIIVTAETGSITSRHQESVTVSAPVGIDDLHQTVPRVYPNPTSGMVVITLEQVAGSSTIKIFNRDLSPPGG